LSVPSAGKRVGAQNGVGNDPRDAGSAPRNSGGTDILTLEDVRFAYPDGTSVLDGISMAVPAGAIVGIVGPSGCGKSTLLSAIAGLKAPSGGSISRRVRPGRHPISMVFQKDTLLPWLTAAENVTFYTRFKRHGERPPRLARLRGRRRAAVTPNRVQELLEMAGLGDNADSYPYQLSGGMRRRLAFLSAVAANPQILLLDEPFSSVDEPTRVGIHQDVFRIARRMEMTTLLVTHDLAEAISLSDAVLILSKRPTRIAERHEIPFGEDRKMLELRETPEFLEIYGRLWHELTEQIRPLPSDQASTTSVGHEHA
jgi:NitT/TauT family transport system ATP-binding protein